MPSPGRSIPFDPDLDARLVERCLAGERGAWDALVRRHERLVYAVARRYRLTDEDLADVFQEVFSALVRGLPRLRNARLLVRWLSSTTERIARSIALRRRREQARAAPFDALAVEPVASSEAPVEDELVRLEEQALVRLALSALGGRCRELLTALYYEDPPPSYAALGRRLGTPVGSLGPTRARCFERLRASLMGLGAGESFGIRSGAAPTSSGESTLARPAGIDPPADRERGHSILGRHT
jgi:RNA polymerase sigma factor (sigma-70 family)